MRNWILAALMIVSLALGFATYTARRNALAMAAMARAQELAAREAAERARAQNVALALNAPVAPQGGQDRALRKFMRQKLTYSQSLLEGLALEDYNLLAKNARELKTLSEDAQWRVSPNINYLRLSNEFQDLADKLEAKAKDRDLDGATLVFFKLTNNCIACHKLVRDERLITRADDDAPPVPFTDGQ
jgi:hypothetical protein